MKLHPIEIAKEFKKYSFFNAFNDQLLVQVATICKLKTIKKGEYLLKRGEINYSLYFLRKGLFRIELEGEKIAEITELGDVIGEMSVISKKPAIADVVALEYSEVFYISITDFQFINPKDFDEIQYLIYRVYCMVLTQRLVFTNDKARKFEIAARELQLAQDELKNFSMSRLSELEKSKSLAFDKLLTLPQETLNHLNILPIIQQYRTEKTVQSKKILLVDSQKKQHVLSKLSLGGIGAELDIASDLIQADEQLQKNKYDLMLCEAHLSEAIEYSQDNNKLMPTILMIEQNFNESLPVLKSHPQIQNIVSRDLEDRASTIKSLVTTVKKVISQDFFGLEKYLIWGSDIQTKHITKSDERLEKIEEMEAHFKKIGIRSQVLDRIKISTEELLMNAIYDAPADFEGKPLYNHLQRTEKVELTESQKIRMQYGTDGLWLAVSVTDPFGRLTHDIIVSYLESCNLGQAGSLNQNKGGAGRGIHMMINSADLTIFNVEKNKRTEVISMINLENVALKKETIPTFHFFRN